MNSNSQQIIDMNSQVLQTTKTMYGTLTMIIGPMYSGKTSTILDLYRIYGFSKISTMVINYAEDTRYSETMLSTHDKVMIPCVNVLKLEDIITPENIEKYQVFLINEGQFFDDILETVIHWVENKQKIVYVCGLDSDFKRNKFGNFLELIPFCDNITKLQSLCMQCKNGEKALFSKRITNDESQIVIGSSNYIPVCRTCYLTN